MFQSHRFITGSEIFFLKELLQIRTAPTRSRIRARSEAAQAPTVADPNTGPAPTFYQMNSILMWANRYR
jgi:hypothetical protein